MTRGVFSDLFGYRPRMREEDKQDRTPLEDWLTECLAACLRSLLAYEETRALSVLAYITGRPIAALAEERSRSEKPTVITQFRCTDGQRPDLVVCLGKKPWIVIESKVEHSATLGQLAGYARWMREASRLMPFETTLVYLTHATPCPDGFVTTNPAFETMNLSRRRWAGIGRALLKACEGLEHHHVSREFCAAFVHHLEDQNMANEYPSSKTMASAQMFMALGLEVELLVDSLLDDVAGIGDFSHQKYTGAQPQFDQGLYAAGRWAKSVRGDLGAQVWVGLWFPEVGSYRIDVERTMGLEIGDTPKIFVTVDSEDLLSAVPECPEGWYRDEEEYLAYRDYDSFADDPTERADAAKAWVRESIGVLKEHLAKS